ncbi:uncharacterized protein LY89DRAFT_708878 [Mollisia scopiformis]|uniref:Integral membrane protein n=1 Tax=Mollisia scopiformis TaxID=149040 RepID=A0A194X0H5_MOLSC|nr:uncharacterized protein LY89DRAFT_708878 [Mollisia scopiformis]KUJ13701.1 hypothetical protein LY89DRAFT_708878 [Mollisia scopiformis]
MADNHLQVPESSQGAWNGRARSGSVRSQLSQRSQRSQASQERNGGFPWSSETADYTRRPSIRIRRTSVSSQLAETPQNDQPQTLEGRSGSVRRNRSASEPQRGQALPPVNTRLNAQQPYMPRMSEEITSPEAAAVRNDILPIPDTVPEDSQPPANRPSVPSTGRMSNWRPLRRARTNIASSHPPPDARQDEYDANLVDLLDLVDPEVATLSTLTNVQNSLFVPDLGRLLNRRPTYNLTRPPSDIEEGSSSSSDYGGETSKTTTRIRPERTMTGATLNTITSNVNDRYYAVLPHGVSLAGWNEEEKLELNDHVRHMLHSKRSKFKRSMRGFRQYIKKPLGFFVTLYATLITLFGLIWVLFLIGWISLGSRKDYIVNVIDNVLVALFAIMGDGLAPFRAVDTYHMCFIAHYHHLTWRLRREKTLPKLNNKNDLPAVPPEEADDEQYSVLSEKQQKRLAHHQKKFARSHSFYKPHETYTHFAFPLRLLVAIVVLLDCHSLLQIALGTCTWAISYHRRPFALTTVILCCSITVNITAGILITVGDHKTRKNDVREKMFRQELTAEALKKVEKKRRRVRREQEEMKEMGIEEAPRREGGFESIVGDDSSGVVR